MDFISFFKRQFYPLIILIVSRLDPIPNCQFSRSHENSASSQFQCSEPDNRSMSRERFDPLYQGVPSQTSNCLPTNFLLLPQLLRSHRSHPWHRQKPDMKSIFKCFQSQFCHKLELSCTLPEIWSICVLCFFLYFVLLCSLLCVLCFEFWHCFWASRGVGVCQRERALISQSWTLGRYWNKTPR